MKFFILIIVSTLLLSAQTCKEYDVDYSDAKERMADRSKKSNREFYALSTRLIDTGLVYLAYCKETITFGDQYQIRQDIKRADKKRRGYFTGAVREYHVIYGIRPKVTEIYQQ